MVSGHELVIHQCLPIHQATGHLALNNQQPSWHVITQTPSVSASLAATCGWLLDSAAECRQKERVSLGSVLKSTVNTLLHTCSLSGTAGWCQHPQPSSNQVGKDSILRDDRTTRCATTWVPESLYTASLASQLNCSFQDMRHHFKATTV